MDVLHPRTALVDRPKLELAEIFRVYQHLLGPLSPAQYKVVRDITNCRTRVLGGHVRQCGGCGGEEISYNSCRNRHCPKCQFLARSRWVEARKSELLPVPYFHVVFTIPHVLNPLVLCNKKPLYELLFRTVSETLKEVGARRLGGAELGFTAVLHTWGQNLMDHPHLHLIVPGGGLSSDGQRWIPTPEHFLLPTPVLSEVFQGKFVNRLERMREQLSYPGSIAGLKEPGRFKHLLRAAVEKRWVVYAKRPFAGPEAVLNYLGNYTHRVAISNYRILKLENDHVHFRYRDRKTRESKVMVLHATEFMRRFLLHVLPPKLVRMRHYGILGSRMKKLKLETCRQILLPPAPIATRPSVPTPQAPSDWKQWLKEKTGVDLDSCRACGARAMRETFVLKPRLRAHLRSRDFWKQGAEPERARDGPELKDTS